MLVPDDEVILISALKAISAVTTLAPGGIGTILAGGATTALWPVIRVTLVGGEDRPTTGTAQPVLQVECWGRDNTSKSEGEAAKLARTVEAAVEDGVLTGAYASGRIVGAWQVGHILKQPDGATGQARYIVQVGLLTQGPLL